MKVNSTSFIAASAGLCLALAAHAGKPILIFNQDSTDYTYTHADGEMNREGILRYVDRIVKNGHVTHFFICPGAQVALFDSKVIGPSWWTYVDAAGKVVQPFESSAICPRRDYMMHTNGTDVVQAYIDGCRRHGVSPWLSMRMNDAHCPKDLNWWGHSKFWVDHPEYHRGGGYKFTSAETRAIPVAFARELLEKYDVDGFECDWMRFPLQQRKEDITAIQREIHKMVREFAQRRGHPIKLAVRVNSRPSLADSNATDYRAWAREGLFDWLIPCNFFMSVDFELPLKAWIDELRALNPKVLVIPGLDTGVVTVDAKTGKRRGRRLLTVAEYCGWADRMYAQGATGIYLFNLFTYHESAYAAKTKEPWDFILDKGLSPESIKNLPKTIPEGWVME